MKKLRFSLCAVGAYLVLVVATILLNSPPVAGQGKGQGQPNGPNVRVINSSAEPVPVVGEVTVASLPAVELDTTTPLQVFDVDNPAFQPFQIHFPLGTDSPQLTVPAGKRLVIEHVTGNAFSSGDVFWMAVLTTAGGEFASHLFPMTKVGVAPSGNNVYVASAQTRIYADPGTNVSIQPDAIGPPSQRFSSISGYLVDVP